MAIPGLKFTKRGELPLGLSFVNSKTIVSRICEHFKITYESLKCKSRVRELVYPRQACMYLLSKHTAMTLTAIGVLFDRDHTTVIHALQNIKDLMTIDDRIAREIEQLKNTL